MTKDQQIGTDEGIHLVADMPGEDNRPIVIHEEPDAPRLFVVYVAGSRKAQFETREAAESYVGRLNSL